MTDYRGYSEWKGWSDDQFMRLDPLEGRYFAAEFAGRPLAGAKLLELGFGNGNFLAWAGAQGAELHGTELIEEAVTMAAQRGVRILPADLAAVSADYAGQFDVIAAFDVLEHIPLPDTRRLLEAVSIMLKPGGLFLARFPNGQSPFGRVFQHADVTHITTMSAGLIPQLIAGLPLTMLYGRDPRTIYKGGLPVRAVKQVKSLIRFLVEKGIKFLYDFDSPMSVNVVVALEKRPPAEIAAA